MIFQFKPFAAIPPVVIALGIGASIASAKEDPVDEAPFVQQYESHVSVGSDHVATEVFTRKFKVLTQNAIETVSEQPLIYIEGVETLDVLEAYTEKADGRRIPVPPKNVLTQDVSADQDRIYYRDEKQRTVIFPEVGVDDTLVMTGRRVSTWGKMLGDFDKIQVFPRSAAYTSIKVTVDAPVSIGLRVNATGNAAIETVDESDGVRRHTVTITPEPYAEEDTGAVSVRDREPVVLMSTYRSHEEVGATYGRFALPKTAVTPDIAALAAEITGGIAGRRAQAVAIDAWMKKNIRYVGVYLSVGRLFPNDASTVLSNGFGDCKDKATLMTALLAAKGIAAEQVLVDAGNAYKLPELPINGAFNHVILYLPEFDLYDDPTGNLSAFGVLSSETYDKPVVRVSADGARLARTPVMKSGDHTAHTKMTVNVAADGAVTGQTEESGAGVFAAALRSQASYVQSLGSAVAVRRFLQSDRTPGSGRFDLGSFTETNDPVVIKGSFALEERFKTPAPDRRTVIPYGTTLNYLPGSYLLGSRFSGRKSAFICFAGREIEDIEMTFASPLPLPQAPAAIRIDNAAFSYRSTAAFVERTLKIHREFVSHVERQVCPPELEPAIAPDLEKVLVNVSRVLTFEPERPSGAANGPVMAARSTAAAALNPVVPMPAGLALPAAQEPAAPALQSLQLAKVVAAGEKVRLEFLYAIEPDCSSMGVTSVRILESPRHGTLTVEKGHGFTGFGKDNQRYDCNMRKSEGTYVFYEPESGFTGADSTTLDIIFPTGQASTQRYAIEVR